MCMNFVHSCVWQLFLKNKRRDKMRRTHALADGNQRIRIMEKMLEFSSIVLSAMALYLKWEVSN